MGKSSYDAGAVLDYLRANVANLTIVDGDCAAAELGSAKTLNVVLLGAALRSGALGLGDAVREKVPPKFLDLNLRSLAWGRKPPRRLATWFRLAARRATFSHTNRFGSNFSRVV